MTRTSEGLLAAELARVEGRKTYLTGLPCKRGHLAPRATSNNTCLECKKILYSEKDVARTRVWRDKNPEKQAASARNWRRTHKGEKNALTAARKALLLKRTPAWADHEKIKAFYRLATAFSDLYVEHHVDHIVPLKGETVSGLHVENNLQVLVGAENLRKSNRLLAA